MAIEALPGDVVVRRLWWARPKEASAPGYAYGGSAKSSVSFYNIVFPIIISYRISIRLVPLIRPEVRNTLPKETENKIWL